MLKKNIKEINKNKFERLSIGIVTTNPEQERMCDIFDWNEQNERIIDEKFLDKRKEKWKKIFDQDSQDSQEHIDDVDELQLTNGQEYLDLYNQ